MKKRLLVLVLVALLVQAAAIVIIFTNPLFRRSPEPCRKSHVIYSAAGAGTNYPIRITVHYGSGTDSFEDVYLNNNGRIDFGDVRFVDDDGVTELDYWMQEKVNGRHVIFWVEVQDDLSLQSQIIYIYYGDMKATTASSITDTFIAAMDTERTAVGDTPVGWRDRSTGTSSATVQNGQSKYGTSSLKLVDAGSEQYGSIEKDGFVLPDRFAVEFAVRASNRAEQDQALSARSIRGTEAWRYMPCSFISYFPQAGMGFTFESVGVMRLMDSSVKTWYEVSIICGDDSNQVEAIYVDGVERLGGTRFGGPVTITSFSWRTALSTAGILWLDGFRVRKYVSPEPTHGWWGPEETVE
jgi:hypothetical protein